MIMVEKESHILLELLTALGNLVFKNELNVSICKDMDISSTCEECKAEGDEDDLNEIKELKKYLTSLLK